MIKCLWAHIPLVPMYLKNRKIMDSKSLSFHCHISILSAATSFYIIKVLLSLFIFFWILKKENAFISNLTLSPEFKCVSCKHESVFNIPLWQYVFVLVRDCNPFITFAFTIDILTLCLRLVCLYLEFAFI